MDGLLVKGGVRDDAAGADVVAAKFKLRFDEDQEIGARSGARNCGGENFGDGDEGNVGDDQVSGFWEVGGLKFARIALDAYDARIPLELPVELIGVDVHGEDASCAVLQEAVGEAAVG